MSEQNACAVPLIELLKSIPADARTWYENSPTSHTNIPFGKHAADAVIEITRLQEELNNAYERAAQVCEAEEVDGKVSMEDEAYNTGLEHAAEAIRALKTK